MGGGRLVSVGSVVVDVVATVEELPPRGGDVWASGVRLVAGGGFHAMAAAARAGARVVYAGAHGTGPFGDLARAAMRAEDITTWLSPHPDLDTGVVVVVVDSGGERTFVSGRGAEATLGPADLADLPLSAGDVVLVSGYGLDDGLADWVLGLPDDAVVAFDPGPLARPGPFLRARPRWDWVSANEAEAAALARLVACGAGVDGGGEQVGGARDAGGPLDPGAVAVAISGRKGAVVRLGARGCVLAEAGAEPVVLPAVAVEAVDTTGAGDTHTGAFLAALLAGVTPVAAARRANAAAAHQVARRR